MEQKDLLYVLFWSFAIAFALYFLGFGSSAPFLFGLSLVGAAFAEKMESAPYAAGSIFLALAFASYFGGSFVFLGRQFVAALLFLVLPFVLLEVRKKTRK